MIRKQILLFSLCMALFGVEAQTLKVDFNETDRTDEKVSPEVREKADAYAVEIREIVLAQKAEMRKEIDAVNAELDEGKIDEEEAERRKKALAAEFSEKIDREVKAVEFDLDSVIKAQVRYSILNTDSDSETPLSTEITAKKPLLNAVTLYAAYGIISLPNSSDKELNKHLGFSSGIDLGLVYNKQFSRSSPFAFIGGLYFSWRTIRLDDNFYFTRNEEGFTEILKWENNLNKSKLRATYLVMPLGVKFTTSKPLTTESKEYGNRWNGLVISANAYGGIRLSNNNIIKGSGINKKRRKTDYNLRDFIAGAQLTLNYRAWGVFVRQEFTPFFKDNSFDNRKMIQVGLNLGF